MTRSCRAVALVALVVCPVGCLGVRQAELLEAQLRQQEDVLYAIRSELQSKSADLAAARRELDLLHTERAAAGQTAVPAEHVAVVTRATGIRFHSLLTRRLDRDGRPGDDVLNVVLTPHDADGEAVKLPGGIRLELLDLSRPESERTVAAWSFPPEEVREHWHSGFIAAGYRFELPWPAAVASPNLLLLGRMTTHDGRHFDTSQPLGVRRPDQPPRVVERPARTDGASDPVGPVPIQETGTAPAEANAESADFDLPTFELPAVDVAHRKATAESPPEPGPLPIASDDPARVAGAAPPFTPEEPPAQVATANASAFETPPRLIAPPTGSAPLHRLGSSLFGSGQSRSFYRSRAATVYGPPTVSLLPAESGQRKPDSQPGTARVSTP